MVYSFKFKKYTLPSAVTGNSNDNLKYSTSDNLIDWQPVIASSKSADICFKFIEDLQFVYISPFSIKVKDA